MTITQKEIEIKLSGDLWNQQMRRNEKKELYGGILSTENRYFADVMSHLGIATIPSSRGPAVDTAAGEIRVAYLRFVDQAHETIYDAILRRDPEGARAAMRAHLTHSRDRLRRAQEIAESEPKFSER